MPSSNFFGAINAGLDAKSQREQQKFNQGQQLLKLDDQRKKAIFTDAREVNTRLASGDAKGATNVLMQRVEILEQLGGDPTDTIEIMGLINSGDIKGATKLLSLTEKIGMQQTDSQGNPFLADLNKAKGVSVQSSKIMDDGTVIEVLKGGGRQVISNTGDLLKGAKARDAVKNSRDQAFNRKKEIARLGQLIRREENSLGLLTDQQKGIQTNNIQRISELSKTSTGRAAAIKKATKFKLALDKGQVKSGAGRIGASFIPGVFTKQAQFDEEFNAFAEIAARQQLKASGETKPTDPDVEGMKRAMFGIGRDEQVNITLLNDFINAQKQETGELDQLIDASKTDKLGSFTFTPQDTQNDIKSLSDDELFN